MSDDARKVVCPNCNAINRIPVGRPVVRGKCGRCRNPLFTGKPFPVSVKGFDAQVRHSDIPVVVDFWAGWCGPCKAMAPAFERVAGELEPEARFLKVDIEAERELAARYHVHSIPMLMLFRQGNLVARRPGASDARSLRAWIEQNIARSPERAV